MTNKAIQIHPILSPYVKDIIIADTVQATSPFTVYPGLTVTIGFQYQGALAVVNDNSELTQLKSNGITGLLTRYRRFQACSLNTKTILLTLYPWAIPYFFKEAAWTFLDLSIGLTDVISPKLIHDLEDKIQLNPDPAAIITVIQDFFIHLLAHNRCKKLNQGIIRMAGDIMASPAPIFVHELAKDSGYSPRSLERHFKTVIGYTPKQFIRTARFQRMLQAIQEGRSWTSLAEELHYVDQSHFIKDFKAFTGFTPNKFAQAN